MDDLFVNVSNQLYDGNGNYSKINTTLAPKNRDSGLDQFQSIIQVLVGIICGIGITGNGINFYLMVQRILKRGIHRERGVYTGFACLALSDILCCLFILPRVLIPAKNAFFTSYSFSLVYQQFGDALLIVFVLCSTWITVQLAISRTLVVCDPFRKRRSVCMKGRWTLVISVAILAASFIFCIPDFLTLELMSITYKQQSGYLLVTRPFVKDTIMDVHQWFRFLLGYALPFIAMLICDICLIYFLRKSEKVRADMVQGTNAHHHRAGHRITVTLVAIILCYIILMTPSEILDFVFDALQVEHKVNMYAIFRPCANLLQTSNFALNFALHLGLNSVCRNALKELICMKHKKRNSIIDDRTRRLSSLYPYSHTHQTTTDRIHRHSSTVM